MIYVKHPSKPQTTGIRFESRSPVFVLTAAAVRVYLIKRQNCIIH
jgi:hypothetical protein